jgi:membrane protein implicated in regulation of membrane protease activity
MPWWGWIVVGAALLGAEVLIPSDFYLVFLGLAAVALGLVGLLGPELPAWGQWALFGMLAVLSLVYFRRWLRDRFPGARAAGRLDDTLVGQVGVLQTPLAPGAVGRIEVRGSAWSARNAGQSPLDAGSRARVVRVEGLLLHVTRET